MPAFPPDIQNTLSAISTAIGVVVIAGGGIGAIAVGILKVFGDKWLNAKFGERLEAYKHAQQRELEELRFQINALMDRTVKLHQREFEVLPEAWGKLIDTYSKTQAHLSFFQQYPDLERMVEATLREFIEKTPFEQWREDEIINS